MPLLSEQETMVADSVAGVLRELGGLARVRGLLAGTDGRGLLARAAENGWTGLLVPEASGGAGMDLRDALVAMRAAGAALPPEPLACAMLTAALLPGLSGHDAVLESALAGQSVVLAMPARRQGERLVGGLVPGLDLAHRICLIDQDDRLELVGRDDGRLVIQTHATRDGGSIGRAVLSRPSGGNALGAGARASFQRQLKLLQAAEMVGLGQEAASRARAHISTRRQFGRPLAAFQALQHRAATVFVQLSAADAMVFEAARGIDGPAPDLAVDTALAQAERAAMLSCKEAVQFFGAMGMAEECDIGLFLRRCMAISAAHRGETVELTGA